MTLKGISILKQAQMSFFTHSLTIDAPPAFYRAAYNAVCFYSLLIQGKASEALALSVKNQDLIRVESRGNVKTAYVDPVFFTQRLEALTTLLDATFPKTPSQHLQKTIPITEQLKTRFLDLGVENRTVTVSCAWVYSLIDALDMYCRIGLGQLDEMAHYADIKHHSNALDHIEQIKAALGYNSPYASIGMGQAMSVNVRCGWDLKKATEKVFMELRDEVNARFSIPPPTFKGVNYDGLIIAYASDIGTPIVAVSKK